MPAREYFVSRTGQTLRIVQYHEEQMANRDAGASTTRLPMLLDPFLEFAWHF
jgi:hypothetical protein